VDGSGDLDQEEIGQIFAKRGMTLTEEELAQAFNTLLAIPINRNCCWGSGNIHYEDSILNLFPGPR
jgi:hypothetical protein